MVEDTRITAARVGASGVDQIKQSLGLGSSSGGRPSASASGDGRAIGSGPRGQRILPADTPLEALDRGAPRGTYLDILV